MRNARRIAVRPADIVREFVVSIAARGCRRERFAPTHRRAEHGFANAVQPDFGLSDVLDFQVRLHGDQSVLLTESRERTLDLRDGLAIGRLDLIFIDERIERPHARGDDCQDLDDVAHGRETRTRTRAFELGTPPTHHSARFCAHRRIPPSRRTDASQRRAWRLLRETCYHTSCDDLHARRRVARVARRGDAGEVERRGRIDSGRAGRRRSRSRIRRPLRIRVATAIHARGSLADA